MARQPRLQFSGAHYLIMNKGDNGRSIFMQHDGQRLFEETLKEACERNGWRLFAHAVLRNRFYLVLETPKGNLTEGMQWLQSAFSNRMNLRRRFGGHIFSGRYKAQLIEPGKSLLEAVDFVHSAPIRLKLSDWDDLHEYRSISSWHYNNNGPLKDILNFSDWQKHMGVFHHDANRFWPLYRNHLMSMVEDMKSDGVSAAKFLSGWVIGSKDYKKRMALKLKEGRQLKDWGGSAMREINEIEWETLLERCLKQLDKDDREILSDRKSASWKVAVAAYLKNKTSVSNPWIGQKLNMGAPAAVSRYVGTFLRSDGKTDPVYQTLQTVD